MIELPVEVPRDRWMRPVVEGVTYTRVSTLAKTLDDMNALMDWNARITALGLARSEDLIAAIATTDPDDKKTLNRIVAQAKERAQSTAKATIGTAVHAATVLVDRGQDLDGLPDKVKLDARAYRAVLDRHGLTPLAAELFVVCDDVGAAGSFDRLLQGPTKVVVADVKTSANPDTAKWAGLAWAAQIATYSHGRPWLPGRGLVDWAELDLPEPDLNRGLVIHIVQGLGQVQLYTVDLRIGWAAAQLARKVLDTRKAKPAQAIR
jgi:hypothetical protein